MKIAIIYPHARIPSPPTDLFDAVSIVVHEHAKRLARSHKVVVYLGQSTGTPGREVHEGVRYERLPLTLDHAINGLKLLDRLPFRRPERPFRVSDAYYVPFAMRVSADLARERFDVVHVHSIVNFLPRFRKALPDACLVLHAHDHALRDFDQDLASQRLLPADLVLACSEHVTRRLKLRYPRVASRCFALLNGVDERFFGVEAKPTAGRRVVFCGRLVPEKGVHVLLAAVDRLKDRFPDLQLDLVGPVDLSPPEFVDPFRNDPLFDGVRPMLADRAAWEGHLRALAAPMGDRVRFVGPVAYSAIPERYAMGNVFAFPSVWEEPFGMPVVEAMATGLPVVATEGGAFPETVVAGRTGLLVPRGDVAALAEALARLLMKPDLRAALGAAGRARAADAFTWDVIVARLIELYEGRHATSPEGD